MMAIPSPTDLAFNFLLWVGVPALVLAPLFIVIGILEWRNAAQFVLRIVDASDRGVAALQVRFQWPRFVTLLIAGALVLSSTFSLMRFYLIFFSTEDPLTGGPDFQWENLWVRLLTYSNLSDLDVKAGLLAAGLVLAVNLFAAVRSKFAFRILAIPGYLVGCLGLVVAVLWTLYIPMVLFLISQNHPGYNQDMLFVYGLGAFLSWVFALSILRTLRSAEKAFKLEERLSQYL